MFKRAILFILPGLMMTAAAAMAADQSSVTTVDNKTVQLDKKFAGLLRGVQKHGVTVVYPTFIPAKFSLKKVVISGDDAQHPDYALFFRGKGHHTLTVETAYTGIGDGPTGDKTLTGQSKVFGKFDIYVFKPHSEGNDTNDIYYLSDWLATIKKTSKDTKRHYHFYATGIKDADAIAMVKSLTPIK